MRIAPRSSRFAGLLGALALGAVACTKVIEAPPPPPAEEPAAPAPAPVKPRPQPTPRRPWPPPPPTAAAQPPDAARVTTVETLNGDPNGLKREDLNNALQGSLPSLAGCFQSEGAGGPPSVGLSFDADGTGKAQNIKVTGASREAERCVTRTLTAAKLPTFEGKSVPVQFPLSVYRQPPPPAPAAPAAAAAAAAAPEQPPKIFVQP